MKKFITISSVIFWMKEGTATITYFSFTTFFEEVLHNHWILHRLFVLTSSCLLTFCDPNLIASITNFLHYDEVDIEVFDNYCVAWYCILWVSNLIRDWRLDRMCWGPVLIMSISCANHIAPHAHQSTAHAHALFYCLHVEILTKVSSVSFSVSEFPNLWEDASKVSLN